MYTNKSYHFSAEQAPAGPRPVSLRATKPSIIDIHATMHGLFVTTLKTGLDYLCVKYIYRFHASYILGLPS